MSDSLKRSHSCGLLTKEAAGEQVVLCGWVAKRRDHGGLIFVDLRDRSGIVQIVVDPDDAGNSFTTAEAIRSEYVIKVQADAEPPPVPRRAGIGQVLGHGGPQVHVCRVQAVGQFFA